MGKVKQFSDSRVHVSSKRTRISKLLVQKLAALSAQFGEEVDPAFGQDHLNYDASTSGTQFVPNIGLQLCYSVLFIDSEWENDENEDSDGEAPTPSPNRGIPQLRIEERVEILERYAAKQSIKKIAREMGRSRSAVARCIRNWTSDKLLTRRLGSGRKVKTTPQDDRVIVNEAKKNPFATSTDIATQNPQIPVSTTTIRRRLKTCGGFDSYFAAFKPYLSPANVIKRLAWAKAHQHWTVDQWKRVLFSDESPFTISFKRKCRVWRVPNSRYDCKNMRSTIKHDKKINVWGGFCASAKTELRLIEGIMETNQYLEIMEDTMVPGAVKLFGDGEFTFQQDNDPKHTARRTKEWFEQSNCKILPWPAQSPDLNPIENLWSILDVKARNRKVYTEAQLFQVLKQAWDDLPNDILTCLVEFMPDRCKAVIAAKGGATKYLNRLFG